MTGGAPKIKAGGAYRVQFELSSRRGAYSGFGYISLDTRHAGVSTLNAVLLITNYEELRLKNGNALRIGQRGCFIPFASYSNDQRGNGRGYDSHGCRSWRRWRSGLPAPPRSLSVGF